MTILKPKRNRHFKFRDGRRQVKTMTAEIAAAIEAANASLVSSVSRRVSTHLSVRLDAAGLANGEDRKQRSPGGS